MLLNTPFSIRLSWSPAELSRWAREQAVHCARLGVEHDTYSCKIFGIEVPGKTPEIRYRRASDPSFWRRLGAKVLRVAQEKKAFEAGAVGAHASQQYASRAAHDWHAHAVVSNQKFLEMSAVFNRETGSVIALADVARTPFMYASMQYSKLKAMEILASQAGLDWAMITLTVPSEMHPNPSRGAKSWDGTMPVEANRYLVQAFNRLRAQLRKFGIALSGFRVEEPHADGCPHWHMFVFYRAEQFNRIAHSLLTQFPGALRIRKAVRSVPVSEGKYRLIFDAVVYQSPADFAAGIPQSASAPAQVQVDLGSTLAGSASFASYALKYVFKYAQSVQSAQTLVPADDEFVDVDFPDELPEVSPALAAVKAHRSAHGLQGLHFFGLPELNSGWELLRQIDLSVHEDPESGRTPPPPLVAEYAALCQMNKGAGMVEFMRQLGGLAAAPLDPVIEVKSLKIEKSNKYGEKAFKTLGVSVRRGDEYAQFRFKAENSLHSRKSANALSAVFGNNPTWDYPVFGGGAELVQLDISKTLLTQQQRDAIQSSIYANNIVLATAGAGKTRVLVERAKFLLGKHVAAYKIWVATFTNKAAEELAERFKSAGIPVADPGQKNGVRIGTIHSLAAYDLLDFGDVDAAAMLGFDACIKQSTELQHKHRHLLLDESQDCSAQQWTWARAVGETVFAVGDFRQSIYGWRGADARSFLCFSDECGLEGGGEYNITVNTRCAANIVALGNRLMPQHAAAAATRSGGEISVFVGMHFGDEAAAILQFLDKAQGTKAVLCRGNAGVARITSLLNLAGVSDVTVSTIHAAKGLEYDSVCVALGERSDAEDSDQSAEVMYVAATRAKSELAFVSVGALPDLLQKALY